MLNQVGLKEYSELYMLIYLYYLSFSLQSFPRLFRSQPHLIIRFCFQLSFTNPLVLASSAHHANLCLRDYFWAIHIASVQFQGQLQILISGGSLPECFSWGIIFPDFIDHFVPTIHFPCRICFLIMFFIGCLAGLCS